MQPRHSRETVTPVRPRVVYFIDGEPSSDRMRPTKSEPDSSGGSHVERAPPGSRTDSTAASAAPAPVRSSAFRRTAVGDAGDRAGALLRDGEALHHGART